MKRVLVAVRFVLPGLLDRRHAFLVHRRVSPLLYSRSNTHWKKLLDCHTWTDASFAGSAGVTPATSDPGGRDDTAGECKRWQITGIPYGAQAWRHDDTRDVVGAGPCACPRFGPY